MRLFVQREFSAGLVYFGPDLIGGVFKIGSRQIDPTGNFLHFFFAKAAGGYVRGSYPDAAGDKGLFRVVGNGVFVDGDLDLVQPVSNLWVWFNWGLISQPQKVQTSA